MAPPRQPSLSLCFEGALRGTVLAPDRDTTTCTALQPSFDGIFVTLLNSQEIRLEVTNYGGGGAGTFDLNDPTTDITLSVVQAAKDRAWSSIGRNGNAGRVTLNPDRSGSLDVTLPARDLSTGGPVPGIPALQVRGTFRCPA
jgi:hypothetical protein